MYTITTDCDTRLIRTEKWKIFTAMSISEAGPEHELRERVAGFFRQEVDNRYRIERLRAHDKIERKDLLEGIDEEDIDRLKGFYKRIIYPVGEERVRRDRNIEKVASIFSDFTTIPMAFSKLVGIVFRHGATLPAAAKTGMIVIKGYRLALRIENRVVETVKELRDEENIDTDDPERIPDELIRRAYTSVPEDETDRMIDRLESIVRLGVQQKILDATRDVLKAVRPTREESGEREGIDYLVGVLDEVVDLASSYQRTTINQLVRIAFLVESGYFEELRRQFSPA